MSNICHDCRMLTRCDRKGHEHLSRALIVQRLADTDALIVQCTGRTRRHTCDRQYLVLPASNGGNP